MRPEEKSMGIIDSFMRSSIQQLVALRGLSQSEGVEYGESYVLGTLQACFHTCFIV